MPSALSSLGTFFANNSGTLGKLAGVAGTVGNAYTGINNAVQTNNYNNTQSYIQSLVRNPAKMAAAAAKFQQPLSAGLTDAVGNQVQASLAERGLGGSPAAMQATLAQALAPYIQQNQNTALQTLMSSLGAGTRAQPITSNPVDLSKLLAQLKGGSTPSDPFQTILQAQQGAGDQSLQTQAPSLGIGVDDTMPVAA